jgi:copper(I)-binding protein
VTRRALISRRALGAVALLSAVGTAASKTRRPGPIAVRLAWARPALAGASAGYLTLFNAGTEPDRLVAAASPWVDRIEPQITTTTGTVTRMRPVVGGLTIGPGKTLTLAPSGYHLMLIGLKRPLKPGDHLPMTLQFEAAGRVRIDLVVSAAPAGGTD